MGHVNTDIFIGNQVYNRCMYALSTMGQKNIAFTHHRSREEMVMGASISRFKW